MSNRKEYIDELAGKMKKWDDDIVALEAKSQAASAEMQAEYRERIEDLRSKKAELERKLEKLKNSGDEAWEEISKGIKNSVDEIKKSFEQAKEKFNG